MWLRGRQISPVPPWHGFGKGCRGGSQHRPSWGQPPAPQGQGPRAQTPIPAARRPHGSDKPRRCSPNIPPAPPAPFGGAPRALPPQGPFSLLSPQILGWGHGPGLPDPAAGPAHGISTAFPHVSEPAGLSLAGRGFRGTPLIALLSSAICNRFCPSNAPPEALGSRTAPQTPQGCWVSRERRTKPAKKVRNYK